MNKKSWLHFRIYTRFIFEDAQKAVRLCEKFFEVGGDFIPSHFDSKEPIKKKFTSSHMSEASEMLARTSYHLLFKGVSDWRAYIYWHKNRVRPWFWTFDFGEGWNKQIKEIVRFLTLICEEFPPVFAAGGLSKDWFEKHDIIDSQTGKFRESAGSSFDPGTGLPGIYWFNFFGKELVDFFGTEKLSHLPGMILEKKDANFLSFCTYERPDQNSSMERRNIEQTVVQALGEEYFFDLSKAGGKRPRKRVPIPRVTDATSLRK